MFSSLFTMVAYFEPRYQKLCRKTVIIIYTFVAPETSEQFIPKNKMGCYNAQI